MLHQCIPPIPASRLALSMAETALAGQLHFQFYPSAEVEGEEDANIRNFQDG